MREFSSISVSAYDAPSLAEQLTEQSGGGWDVVSIVSTGSTVTAYLCRDVNNGAADATALIPDTASSDDAAGNDSVYDSDTEVATLAPGEASRGDGSVGSDDDSVYSSDSEVPSLAGGSVAAVEPAADDSADEAETPAPAEETSEPAAGWAATSSATEAASEHDVPGADAAPVADTSQQTAATQAASDAAPAGWYADPASRFELRYWDGAQWTEHVSRGGQQFTDPPVA